MKRIFDIIISLAALVFLLPFMVLIGLMVRIQIGRPVLFKQERPGKKCRPFIMYKFRTMKDIRTGDGELLPDKDRIDKFGAILRSLSIDELPELINVLKGDMSIVGPRPLLMEYIPLYTSEQNKRHDVLPGITGWAQINGRNSISWEQKFNMDVWYVENCSFYLDMKIILLSVFKVLKRSGINNNERETMPYFKGQ
jgi:sugar transferase EpsL